MNHGEKLNAEVGVQHERLWSKDEELDQLVDVFDEDGITIASKHYTVEDFEDQFTGDAEFKDQARREYVRKLGEQLESYIEDMAS